MYSTAAVMTAEHKIAKDLREENEKASIECDMLSKPMKAQGEITAIKIMLESALLFGKKAGAKEKLLLLCRQKADAKQTAMVTVKIMTKTSAKRALPFLLLLHSNPVRSITKPVSRASPR